LKDHYQILDLSHGCADDDIKKAFRRKAKEIHPDITRKNGTSQDDMLSLLRAYEILSNPIKREFYDRTHHILRYEYKFNYRDFLKQRTDDYESQSKLIFFDLLHEHPQEALDLYESLLEREGFDLAENMDREDFMDCSFLLAEEYEKQDDFIKAYHLLKTLIMFEYTQPYFRHFIEEVTDRIRALTCFRMPGVIPNELLIQYIEELIKFNLSSKDTAFYFKKLAELYSNSNRNDIALFYLRKGLELDHKLSGVKKLKDKIGYTE
jgi:curved DNA-binding protein CbpA